MRKDKAVIVTLNPRIHAQLSEPQAKRFRRTCKNCLNQWDTLEICVSKAWPSDIPCVLCPSCGGSGNVQTSISKLKTTNPGAVYASPGLTLVIQLGGHYRRRKCKMCGKKWTTGEFRADGWAEPDVGTCDRCGQHRQTMEEY